MNTAYDPMDKLIADHIAEARDLRLHLRPPRRPCRKCRSLSLLWEITWRRRVDLPRPLAGLRAF